MHGQTLLQLQFLNLDWLQLTFTSSAPTASKPTHACFKSATPVDDTVLLQSLHSVFLEKSGRLTQCTYMYHWMMKHIKLSRECLAVTQVPFE